jgi:WD40 repeat protein
MRTNAPIYRKMLHKGAVNSIKVVEDEGLLISCSASGNISVLAAPHFEEILTINAKDMVFYVEEAFGTIVAATAKGNILGFDLHTGEPLYGYGVMKKGGCRLLGVSEDKTRLVCAGEDESACLLRYR